MTTVEKEVFSLGIKYKNPMGVIEDVHFLNCTFSANFQNNRFDNCIFEGCTLPENFADSNNLKDCIY